MPPVILTGGIFFYHVRHGAISDWNALSEARCTEHAPSFAYRVTSRQALALLAQIQPDMRSYKAKRADFALAHYTRLTARNGK